ncbi:hypothetical protein Tco_0464892 [Tanacetum coccineum]
MLEWYDNSAPTKASSNTGFVTPKSIPHGLSVQPCDETMILYTQLSGVDSCVTETSDLLRIDAHLEIGNCNAVHFDGLCHEGLSHDETFGTDNLDPPPPFDLNILAHVSDEVIVSNHAMVQDRVNGELGNEKDVVPLRVDEQCQTEHDDVNHDRVNEDTHNGLERNTSRVDEHLDNDNAPLEIAAWICEDIHNDSDPRDCEYDADSIENKGCKDDDDVMIDEDRGIDEAEVEVYLFGLKESNHDFITIGVSSQVPENVFMVNDRYEWILMTLILTRVVRVMGHVQEEVHLISSKRLSCESLHLVKVVQDQLQRELELQILMSKAFRAKAKADKEIRGFKAGKREFLGLDGAFMKGPFQGQVLSALRTDANNDLQPNINVTFTIDRKKKSMDEFKSLNVRAHAWLNKIPPEHWSEAYFSGRAHTYILLNNICEVFNHKIVGGRDKLVITLLEYIKGYYVKRIVNVQKVINKCDGPMAPSATRILKSIKKESTYNSLVEWKWEIRGIPYKHAITINWNMVLNGQVVGPPEEWVHPCYWLSTWKKVYSHKVELINGRHNIPTCKGHGQPSKKGGMFGNQGKASGSQVVGSQAGMVESQAVCSQPTNMGSEANGIGT